jgi:subtilisin family serine protease
MRSRPHLEQAAAIADYTARGQFVMDELKRNASASQASIISFLQRRNVKFQAFWVANVVLVEADDTTRSLLADRDDVQSIEPDAEVKVDIPPPIKSSAVDTADLMIGDNVSRVRAPEAWDLGTEGKGIVVGIIDTGFAPHPAISAKFRGYEGSPTSFNNNYNWYSTVDNAGTACSNAPCDGNGHGTHVTGTVVGRDANDAIGVAPEAQFIACRALNDQGAGTASTVIYCLQWMLAPTDTRGRNANAALRPQIVSMSLGAGKVLAMGEAITDLESAGILPIAAAGNSGGCTTISYPGGFSNVLTVGALKADSDTVTNFSSGGPTSDGLIKPDVVAQGEAVRSAWLEDQYNTISGTSMATPAVSGVAALVMSAAPHWIGRPAGVAAILRRSANGNGISIGDRKVCSGDPRNLYGAGLVDAYEAVREAEITYPRPE